MSNTVVSLLWFQEGERVGGSNRGAEQGIILMLGPGVSWRCSVFSCQLHVAVVAKISTDFKKINKQQCKQSQKTHVNGWHII